MPRTLLAGRLFASALACCLLWPACGLRAQSSPSAEQQLIAADRSILEAMTGPHPDTQKLTHLLAPEYTDVEQGEAEPREAVLQSLNHITDFKFTYASPRAVIVSPTAGYVIAEVHYSFAFIKRHNVTTTAFVLRNAEWHATLHTEIPAEDDQADVLATSADSRPAVIGMRKLAVDVMSATHISGYAPFPFYPVYLDAGPAVSFSDGKAAHEADFKTLPPPMQQVWTQWASYTSDEPSGEALFSDMFYRFFLVHELGHLITGRVYAGLPEAARKQSLANMRANATEKELVANRIAVAWFRERDPQYLARLVADFRLIQAHLPNPVPTGVDPKKYFTENHLKLSADPVAYGWYQLYMVITAYAEAPKTFQQTLATLPTLRYNEE